MSEKKAKDRDSYEIIESDIIIEESDPSNPSQKKSPASSSTTTTTTDTDTANKSQKPLKDIGQGSLAVTVTYWPQVDCLLDKQKEILLAQGKDVKSTPSWFTSDDFKEVLKELSGVIYTTYI